MEILGWIGTALVIAAYYPQIRHLYAEKCAWGISLTTWWIWLISSWFLLIYALLGGNTIFVLVQAISILAIVTTIVLAKRSGSVCPYHSGRQRIRKTNRKAMLYPEQMTRQKGEKNAGVNPRLRKKMLDRWENEGGKVAETEPDLGPTHNSRASGSPHRRSKGRSFKS